MLNSIKNKGLLIKTHKKHNFTLDLEIALVYLGIATNKRKTIFRVIALDLQRKPIVP